MRRLSHAQLQNLIFTGVVMLVAAAAAVWLLLGGGLPDMAAQQADGTPTAASTPEAAREKERFMAAPVSVLLAQLESDERLRVERRADTEYALGRADDPEGADVLLRLTESNGCATSFLWIVYLPEQPAGEPRNEIERRLAEGYEDALAAVRERVKTILPAVIRAGDLNGLLLEPTLLAWSEGAAGTLDTGKSYRNVTAGCTFTAYLTQDDGQNALTCALLLP